MIWKSIKVKLFEYDNKNELTAASVFGTHETSGGGRSVRRDEILLVLSQLYQCAFS